MWKKLGLIYISLLLLLSVTISLNSCTDKAKSFRFIFMTDIHLQPERRAYEGFSSAIEKTNALDPDFVIVCKC